MLATVLSCHAGDGAAGVSWPRRDVDVESCWRWCYRGDLAAVRYRCRVMLATVLPSHASNDAANQGYTGYGKVVQPSSLEHQGVVAS
jgi:hypothetical protein